MGRNYFLLLVLVMCWGCSRPARMDHAEDPEGPYREQIAAARHILDQRENWADRAEWEVKKNSDGWQVIAWRVERPGEKGADRYLPWGYSVIQLDSHSRPVEYHNRG